MKTVVNWIKEMLKENKTTLQVLLSVLTIYLLYLFWSLFVLVVAFVWILFRNAPWPFLPDEMNAV